MVENNGSKPYEQMDDLGVFYHPYFWFNIHIIITLWGGNNNKTKKNTMKIPLSQLFCVFSLGDIQNKKTKKYVKN